MYWLANYSVKIVLREDESDQVKGKTHTHTAERLQQVSQFSKYCVQLIICNLDVI